MTHTYNISGMTCGNCVAKAKHQLLMLPNITEAEVQLTAPQARLTMDKHISINVLQDAVHKAGNYTISEVDGEMQETTTEDQGWLHTYKPLLLIGFFITGITLLVEATDGVFNWQNWMQNFMAAFFIVFSFFKLLNLKGFAQSYSSYDIIAKRWSGWGYIYAFLELALGLSFLTGFKPLLTNSVTFIVMSLSIIGVLQTVLNKRKIQCACLGTVFSLPMSTVTIVEDAVMIAMSGSMLVSMS